MGACIALPFLEAMALPGVNTPAYGNSPLRTGFLFMPNGVHPNHWTPEKFGSDFELTRQLLPLQNLRSQILVLGELMNKNSLFKGADGHYAKSASLLTCMPIKQTIGDNISKVVVFRLIRSLHQNADTKRYSPHWNMALTGSLPAWISTWGLHAFIARVLPGNHQVSRCPRKLIDASHSTGYSGLSYRA